MKIPLFLNHYEKIILAAALGFFMLSLLWLIGVFYSVSAAKSGDIVVAADKVAYQPIDKNTYASAAVFNNSKFWLESEKRTISPNDPDYILTFTDFMVPFEIARSNAPKAGNKLIPYIYYMQGICPISKEKISIPEKTVANTDSLDTDKDGIPDSVEKRFNMDPKNPNDVYNDNDNDSFSNYQEYLYNKNGISNKNIHPPLVDRLVLLNVSNTRIPFILKKIIKHGNDIKDWDVQVNVKLAKKGWTTKFLKIGDSVEINDMVYTLTDIQYKTDNVLNPRLGVVVERDLSTVVLHNSLGEKITAENNQQVYEPNRKITLKDLYTGKLITARISSTITLGNKDSKLEKYKIINTTNNNNSVEFEKNGKIFVVDKNNSYKPPVKSTIMSTIPSKEQKK